MILFRMNANLLISLKNSNISLVQFESVAAAFQAINTVSNGTLLELIPLLNGQILSIFASETSLLSVHEELKKQTQTKTHAYLENVSPETLKAFYSLQKPVLRESVLVGDVTTMVDLFQILHFAKSQSLEILDHKNQRGFATNSVFISGSFEDLQNFLNRHKSCFLKATCLKKLSPSLLNFFGCGKPE